MKEKNENKDQIKRGINGKILLVLQFLVIAALIIFIETIIFEYPVFVLGLKSFVLQALPFSLFVSYKMIKLIKTKKEVTKNIIICIVVICSSCSFLFVPFYETREYQSYINGKYGSTGGALIVTEMSE